MDKVSPDKSPSLLSSQWPLIGAALFISMVVWLMAKQGELESGRINIPISFRNVPESVNVEVFPRQLPVVARFPQNQRSRVVAQNFEIVLDANKLFGNDPRQWAGVDEPISHPLTLGLDNIVSKDLPQSIRITQIDASPQIQIEATLHTRWIQVSPRTQGRLPEQYEKRQDPRAKPDRVRVVASPEALERFSRPGSVLRAAPVKLEGRTEDFLEYRALQIPPDLELVNETDRDIEVSIFIREREITRTLEKVPIALFVLNENLRAKINPPSAEIRIRGKISLVAQIDQDSFVFSSKEFLPEEKGKRKTINIDVLLREDVPEKIRKNVRVDGFLPTTVTVEYVATKPSR